MKGKRLPIYAKLSQGRRSKRSVSSFQPLLAPTEILRPSMRVHPVAGRFSHTRIGSSFEPNITHDVPVFHSGFKNGSASKALFNKPSGLALDAQQNLWVSDTYNHCIRRITKRGRVTTFAGNARGHQDGPLAQALFSQPSTLYSQGDSLYVLEKQNKCLRVIRNGEVFTLPLSGVPMGGVAIDSENHVYYTSLLPLSPEKICLMKRSVHGHNYLLVSQQGRVQWLPYQSGDEIKPFTVWTSDGNLKPEPVYLNWADTPSPLALDAQDTLYTFQGTTLVSLKTEGPVLKLEPLRCHWGNHVFRSASALCFNEDHFIVCESHYGRVYSIDFDGNITHLAGDAGEPYPTLNTLKNPQGLAQDPLGRLFIADTGHWRVCRLDPPEGDPWHKILSVFSLYTPRFSAPPEPAIKGLTQNMPKPSRRKQNSSSQKDRPLPPSLVLPIEHIQGVVAKGSRQQVLECGLEVCETLKHPTRPSLTPALPVLDALLKHSEVSVRTLMYKEMPQFIHTAEDALHVIHLLDTTPDENRILRRYRVQLLAYLGERFHLQSQVIPQIVEGLKDPEDSISQFVFDLLKELRQKGHESLIDPLVEDLAHDD